MNKIYQLLDEKYVKTYLAERILPQYPEFVEIVKIKIKPWKKHIWHQTYHAVIEFSVSFKNSKGQIKVLPIFCSAHSDEPRKNVYDSLKFLWSHGFGKGFLTIPHPLYYSNYFRGTFYEGVEGQHLYYYIRENNFSVIEKMVVQTAKWFSKLHALKVDNVKNFNEENSRIRTVFPGVAHIHERIKKEYSRHYNFYLKSYDIFIKNEEDFLASSPKRWMVHGDAHPENVIRMGENKIGVIDFTDLCLSDFARDLGTFLQQLSFMCNRKIKDQSYSQKVGEIFLHSYFAVSREKYNDAVQKRIDNYYNWTSMRTATYFLLKHDAEPQRATLLIEEVRKKLKI